MFYVPFKGNASELARLEACVERYKAEIVVGKIPIRVDGHCSATGHGSLAKFRSNRVKSELITRQGLTEGCFITRNHSGSGDYVTVRLAVHTSSGLSRKAEAGGVPDVAEGNKPDDPV